ncbi:hypothetical protein SISNIDRAFT_419545 [Sistotremastrum niveocremeum HHB9708]|uniref:Fe2OG dioxygenase domain-containing protein n=2 Tax=Sistotremastraceae TaxID=3402574 RepID=A0A164N969_9AGAM|nr:hypothetical protein SISNIDRAFT_419545 [Sistotremastrum niveocremeum HHB9708]KZT37073.1 hypothetical protein SISSUDRAFT_988255 [Sistotremastrum suecicum HHB10207 ss-3]
MKATEVLESKFGVSKTYEDAPDPDLRVAGFGNVALPLTEEKARELVQVCHQAPYGKKEQTLVDTSVRDTWEIDADRVLFKNPLWQKWLKSVVVNTVAKQLGVASISGWELYKMLLYQEGSHFLPHQDTEKSPGMVATIIVVLPSAFEGGEVHLSHNGTKKILDVATSSSTATSVLAWYSDVRHEVKPITSGYRLALSYNLMIPIGVPQPDVAGNSKMMAAVRHVLLSWKQSFGPQIPNKLACVLDHEYSLNGLQSGAFKGDDIRTVEVLWKLAQECGFKLHFAKAEYIAVRNAIHTPNGDCDAGEDISTEINLHNVLDADAKPVKLVGSASYFDGDDFFPRDLDDDDPDDEQYEEYTGNVSDLCSTF